MNCPPKKLGIRTLKKEMFDGFWFANKTSLPPISIPIMFAKLSLVGVTPLWKNQRKISIFKGNLSRQTNYDILFPLLTGKLYIDFTIKTPFLSRRHTNTSSPCCRLKLVTLATRWFHSRSLFSTNALLNSTLSGVSLRPLQPALRISFVQNWKVLGIGILMASYQAKNLPRTWFGYHYAILNYPNSRCP